MSRSRRIRKRNDNPQLIIGGVALAGCLLFAGSVWFATRDGPSTTDDLPPAEAPPEVSPQASPRVAPPKISKPTPSTAAKDPYAELQEELKEPLPLLELTPQELTPKTGRDPSADLKREGEPATEREAVEIKRVVDGDTVHLTDGRKVRLIGINTPERGKPLYQEAKECLAELVTGGNLSLQLGTEPTDRYGRTLAYLYSGNTLLNGKLLERGLAYCYTWRPNDDRKDELRELQRQARSAKLGLWGLERRQPKRTSLSPAELPALAPDQAQQPSGVGEAESGVRPRHEPLRRLQSVREIPRSVQVAPGEENATKMDVFGSNAGRYSSLPPRVAVTRYIQSLSNHADWPNPC